MWRFKISFPFSLIAQLLLFNHVVWQGNQQPSHCHSAANWFDMGRSHRLPALHPLAGTHLRTQLVLINNLACFLSFLQAQLRWQSIRFLFFQPLALQISGKLWSLLSQKVLVMNCDMLLRRVQGIMKCIWKSFKDVRFDKASLWTATSSEQPSNCSDKQLLTALKDLLQNFL